MFSFCLEGLVRLDSIDHASILERHCQVIDTHTKRFSVDDLTHQVLDHRNSSLGSDSESLQKIGRWGKNEKLSFVVQKSIWPRIFHYFHNRWSMGQRISSCQISSWNWIESNRRCLVKWNCWTRKTVRFSRLSTWFQSYNIHRSEEHDQSASSVNSNNDQRIAIRMFVDREKSRVRHFSSLQRWTIERRSTSSC